MSFDVAYVLLTIILAKPSCHGLLGQSKPYSVFETSLGLKMRGKMVGVCSVFVLHCL